MHSEIFDLSAHTYDRQKHQQMSFDEYLEGCSMEFTMYESTGERMVPAIDQPTLLTTDANPKLDGFSAG
jgi:predicted Ser/Thr protein kinase